ncbi:hypothetical protein HNQ81_003101 [Desulfoprunum benzoelyticum]|uniref:Uncharacterized protein n=1 Tax=Desulfoprunum benzoelyticum TaxID=1506996 RepID=A0A840V3E6_9BACT|nr:hypothetical protein [Desulfoprunum benzoelyticum]
MHYMKISMVICEEYQFSIPIVQHLHRRTMKKRTIESRDSMVLLLFKQPPPKGALARRTTTMVDQAAEPTLLTLMVKREILREAAFL